jgi:hypothetical protein
MVSMRQNALFLPTSQQMETDGYAKRRPRNGSKKSSFYVADHNRQVPFKEVLVNQHNITDIYAYMRCHAALLGERILQEYPALHQFDDAVSAQIGGLLRKPFPAQNLAIMGVAKRWQQARTAMVVAECGTGKTLISLGAMHVRSQGSPFTALAIVIATIKWPFGQYMLPQREEEEGQCHRKIR